MDIRERQQRIGEMFDRIAHRYDLLNSLLSARQDRRWRRVLVSRVPHVPKGRLLDVATGTGDVLIGVAARHAEYAEYVGVDISLAMMAHARAKVQVAALLPKSRFEEMGAAELKFPDAAFDCLTIAFGLRNVLARDQALSEFARVLKSGGTLLVLEFFEPRHGLLAALFLFYFKTVLPFIGGLLSDRSAYEYLPKSVGTFASPARLAEELDRAGFRLEENIAFLFGACRLVHAVKR